MTTPLLRRRLIVCCADQGKTGREGSSRTEANGAPQQCRSSQLAEARRSGASASRRWAAADMEHVSVESCRHVGPIKLDADSTRFVRSAALIIRSPTDGANAACALITALVHLKILTPTHPTPPHPIPTPHHPTDPLSHRPDRSADVLERLRALQKIVPEWLGTRMVKKDAADMILGRTDVLATARPSMVEWFVLSRSCRFEDVRAKIAKTVALQGAS